MTPGKALFIKEGGILTVIATSGAWTAYIEPFLGFIALLTAAAAGVVRLLVVWEQWRQAKQGTRNDD